MPTADKTKDQKTAKDGQKTPIHVRPQPIRHDKVTNDQERREMLLWLINTYGGSVAAVARNSTIQRVHIEQLVSGAKNLLGMREETLNKLLTVLNLPDTEAWELLNIPLDIRKKWRTLRPPPMGHGNEDTNLSLITLDQPLAGDISVPAGYRIRIDRTVTDQGVIVARLSGRYYATRPDAVPASADVLGRLITIDMLNQDERRAAESMSSQGGLS
ncbi:hypothetical protein K7W42_20495 [Deinococcus sp. HMF7604]|uniref:hypothetical protein n=1 Tax=Deinococcus betulae TaxID=2873312 RepID=UPI001CCD7B68|nr:hypothetical protein [Deinococcus betulae]MBZ9753220.1 hypothetical protein [Deinococcus betulae]